MTVNITTTLDLNFVATTALSVAHFKSWANLPADFTEDDSLVGDIIIPDSLAHLTREADVSYYQRSHAVQAESFGAMDFHIVGQGHAGWTLEHYDASDGLVEIDSADYRSEVIGDRVVIAASGGGFPVLDSERIMPVRLTFTTSAVLDGAGRAALLSLCMIRYVNRGDDWTEKVPASVRGLIDLVTRRRAY